MRRRTAGVTLIELMVVVTVIGIIAALIVPTVFGNIEKARMASELDALDKIGTAFRRFHVDTSAWPYREYTWPRTPGLWDATRATVGPAEFGAGDTALFVPPRDENGTPWVNCNPPRPRLLMRACWGGPYLAGAGAVPNMGQFKDAWGKPRMYLMVPPSALGGEAGPGVSAGMIVIWSRGPDGRDQTGCWDGACTRNIPRVVKGLPSVTDADDVISVVSAAR